MSLYTRPRPSEQPNILSSAPGLIFQKWQAWDDFSKFKRENARPDFLREVARAVQNVYQNSYAAWRGRYLAALETLGVNTSVQYKTVWRLLVGWGSNPTLEAGMTLHHLYGFPYIPGSAVKGLLHHVAEMEVMEILPAAISPLDQEKLLQALRQLQLIKILFGLIHLEQGLNKKTKKKEFGPECPRPRLENLHKQLQDSKLDETPEWNPIVETIDKLLNENTGGMLCFYDAVPEVPESEDIAGSQEKWLLQTDIVNCHYNDYYGSEGSEETPPSDDQNPNPVTFLAVKPGTEFTFPFRLADWPATPGRDPEEKERWQALQPFTQPDDVIPQVKTWLQKALGEYGLGAKTAAGYGYFDTGAIPPPADANLGNVVPKKVIAPEPETPIIPVEPAPFQSNANPKSKINGIGKNHNQPLWQRLAANEHILKIDGKPQSLKAFGRSLPGREISPNGAAMQVFYQNDKFYCAVELTLQGIKCLSEAEHLWLNVIVPELKKG